MVTLHFRDGRYPDLLCQFQTTPKIARLMRSPDRRKQKRGLRLLQKQQRAKTWARLNADPETIAGVLRDVLNVAGFEESGG